MATLGQNFLANLPHIMSVCQTCEGKAKHAVFTIFLCPFYSNISFSGYKKFPSKAGQFSRDLGLHTLKQPTNNSWQKTAMAIGPTGHQSKIPFHGRSP